MRKILTCAVISVAIFSLCGAVAVNAQTEGERGLFPSIVQKLVERFGLNAEEVQEVFDEAREERLQEMRVRFEERAGERMDKFTVPECAQLTDEQKEALSAEREGLKEKYGDLKGLSREEMQAKMQEMRAEMEAWAEEQGIDLRCAGFMSGWCERGFKGLHKGFGWGFGR